MKVKTKYQLKREILELKLELFKMVNQRPTKLLLFSMKIADKQGPGYYVKNAKLIDKLANEQFEEDCELLRGYGIIK